MKYLVVHVELDYDYVAGVKFVESFDCKKDAEKFVDDEEQKALDSQDAIKKYHSEYVQKLNLPEWYDDDGWSKVYKRFGIKDYLDVERRQRFPDLQTRIGENPELFDDYNPPDSVGWFDLKIVTIANAIL